MKKFMRSRNFLYISLLALILTIIPYKAHTVDISVGATTWYTWWDFNVDETSWNGSQFLDVDKAAFMYGPTLALKIMDDFSITFVFLYGKFEMTEDIPANALFGYWPPVDYHADLKYKRRDSDLAFNYKLNDYFKLFAGIKYLGFQLPYRTFVPGEPDADIKHFGYGPGLGVGVTYPIIDNIFLLGNISGIYLWGKEKLSGSNTSANEYSEKYNEYGINSSLSIAYYIAPASTAISLGGRYQYVRTLYEGTERVENWEFEVTKLSNISSHIYGITLSATYTFSI